MKEHVLRFHVSEKKREREEERERKREREREREKQTDGERFPLGRNATV
jgi:hypothetical protein